MTPADRPAVGRLNLVVRGISVIVSVAAAVLIVRAAGLDGDLDQFEAWLAEQVRAYPLWGEVIFCAVAAGATAVGLPRQAFAIVGGYVFGVALGTSLTLVASVAGCAMAFAYARVIGRDVVARRIPKRLRGTGAVLRDSPFLVTLAVRLMPVGSNLAVNLIAGVSGISAVPFLAGSALGYLPQTVVFALVGSGVQDDIVGRSVVAVILFLASAAIGVHLVRRHRTGRGRGPSSDARTLPPTSGAGGT